MSRLIAWRNKISENENETVEAHIPRHRDSKTRKLRHRDSRTENGQKATISRFQD